MVHNPVGQVAPVVAEGLLGSQGQGASAALARHLAAGPLLTPLAPPLFNCRLLNTIRSCTGFVRLHGGVPSWRRLGAAEVTPEQAQTVAAVGCTTRMQNWGDVLRRTVSLLSATLRA